MESLSLLDSVTKRGSFSCPVLFVMTNGGPVHNCKYLFVQMSWLGVFLKSGMGMLVVSHVAPT